MDFSTEMKARADQVEKDLEACFTQKFDAPDIIVSAMKYSLFAGGKRLRPVLMKAVCEILGGSEERIRPLSSAMEMIHTMSLVHDDLPAMDNDELRRGKPTNHVVYGEDIAILAGDALLNFAMETAILGLPTAGGAKVLPYAKAMNAVFQAAGVNGMIGGQTADLINEGMKISEEQLYYIHEHKTAALLKASVLAGAYVAEADEATLEALSTYSDKIGLSFQIVDDILDVTGSEEELGKPIGSDEKNAKTTFVTLYGMESSRVKVAELEAEALAALDQVSGDTTFLEEMARYISGRHQ